MLFRRFGLIAAFALLLGMMSTGANSAPSSLSISGTILNPSAGMSVLVVADDGTSASSAVDAAGNFRVVVASANVRSKIAPGKGAGATMHLLRDGIYVGPFLFKKKGTAGYTRLSPKIKGSLKLGKLTVEPQGYVLTKKALKTSKLDSKRKIALVNGVPAGAGTQGATGALRTTGLSKSGVSAFGVTPGVRAFEALPPGKTDLGSDADGDGVPNLADVDMNGDQVIDAAQAAEALPVQSGGTLGGTSVLTGRPAGAISFSKVLNTDRNYSVNSNKNPSVDWTTLAGYLTTDLSIETVITSSDMTTLLCPTPTAPAPPAPGGPGAPPPPGDPGTPPPPGDGSPKPVAAAEGPSPVAPCAAASSVARVTMDCRTLSYCMPGTTAMITAEPGTALDHQSLAVLLDGSGLITMPQDTHSGPGTPIQTGFQLSFKPNASSPTNLQFVGDSFEFTFYDAAGTELARQAKVLTSSVTTAPEWRSVAGTAVTTVDDRSPIALTSGSAAFEFYRPQRLDPASEGAPAPTFIDRGGLQYRVYMIASQQNQFYWCASSQITPNGPDMTKVTVVGEMPGRDSVLFDSNVAPANGGVLGFTLDVAGCLSAPVAGSGPAPASGTTMTVELESVDSDNNRTRTQAYILAP